MKQIYVTGENDAEDDIPEQDKPFYVTKSGQKFHRADCYIIKGKNVFALDIEKALEMGYQACKICRPQGD